jgi:predicted dehydrogenase
VAQRLQRRQFLQASAAVGAGYWIGHSNKLARADSANDKLNLAVIGIGGQGSGNLKKAASHNIVALCDVDDVKAGKAYETYPRAKKFYDFRQMFDAMEKQIDGVVISTPDHMHFHPAWWALQRGKHVYLEKPMAHSVWEVRELTKLAAKQKVATQLGVQRHTLPSVRRSVELIQSGAIGTVRECHSWIASSRGMPDPIVETPPIPSTMKWDLWLGPAPEHAYSPELAPYKWRFWWNHGTGEAGNWGCHILDIAYWALGLRYPTKVEGSGPPPDADRTPKSMATRFEFPATDKRPAVTLHWYQGAPQIVKTLKVDDRDMKGMNTLLIGSGGMLLCGFSGYRLLPQEKFKDVDEPKAFLPPSPGFHQEWFDACRGGKPASCQFDYSGPMSETVLLGNIAYRVQGSFGWDSAALATSGNDAAQQLIRTPFRQGWEI